MDRKILMLVALVAAASATAQETYENARIATEDLNGTARYVGMGGALDALGADLSTIGTNPAGIGLFRHSQAKISFGFVSQQDARDFDNANKTNMSFDQVGFVYSMRNGRSRLSILRSIITRALISTRFFRLPTCSRGLRKTSSLTSREPADCFP